VELVSYAGATIPVRDDLVAAHDRAWARLASPGTWWTGVERVAIAEAVRAAARCRLCRDRKGALSPAYFTGAHDGSDDVLPASAVDAAHRIATDPARLSRKWFDSVLTSGLGEGRYVELLGVVAPAADAASRRAEPPSPDGRAQGGRLGRDAPARKTPGRGGGPLGRAHGQRDPRALARPRRGARAPGPLARPLPVARGDDRPDPRARRPRSAPDRGEVSGDAVDLRAVVDATVPSGVAHGEALLALADAVVGEDVAGLERARERLLAELGPEGFVDAAAVAANFERMVRIADATGIPLDTPVRMVTLELRDELSLGGFRSAANTPAPVPGQRLLGRALRPFTSRLMRRVFRRRS
jgi:hypothetical protein